MSDERRFAAPWSPLLKVCSWTCTAAFPVLGGFGLVVPQTPLLARIALVVIPLTALGVCALFTVRGYEVTPDALLVRRLFWWTSIRLSGLISVEVAPVALLGSLRTCGNGGLFAFSGWYWNRRMGRFRMMATNLKRVVVLTFEDTKLVVSPGDPEAFIRQVRRKAGLA